MRAVGRIFLTGVLTVLPVLATVYLIVWLLGAAERFVGQQLMWLIPDEYYRTGMGLALAVLAIFAVGLLMNALLFRRLFDWGEKLLLGVPLLRSIYGALRDFFGLFASGADARALQVVSVTLPGTPLRAIGFVTRSEFEGLPEGLGRAGEVAVYLPLSYQIGGFTFLLPRELAEPIEMSREEAMRFVLTAGLQTPPQGQVEPK